MSNGCCNTKREKSTYLGTEETWGRTSEESPLKEKQNFIGKEIEGAHSVGKGSRCKGAELWAVCQI